ncbi:MAG: LURP-one-related/scramblase family protein [Candidatus Nanohaloarchaea archaeon]
MEREELVQRAEESLRYGFEPEEIVKALRQDGYSDETINQVMTEVRDRLQSHNNGRQEQRERSSAGNRDQRKPEQAQENTGKQETAQNAVNPAESRAGGSTGHQDTITGVELTDDHYTLKQKLIRNKYRLYDQEDRLILKAKQKLFKLKEDIPFKDADDNTVFRVKAESMLDVAGDYTLVDEGTEEPVAILEKQWSFLHHKWKIKTGDNTEQLMARISSRGGVDMLRFIGDIVPYLPNVFAFVPHEYTIEDPEGREIGEIKGHFGLRDVYEIKVDETGDVPKETVIAASIAVDALEGN